MLSLISNEIVMEGTYTEAEAYIAKIKCVVKAVGTNLQTREEIFRKLVDIGALHNNLIGHIKFALLLKNGMYIGLGSWHDRNYWSFISYSTPEGRKYKLEQTSFVDA